MYIDGTGKRGEAMMKRLVKFPSESGESILVEVEDVGGIILSAEAGAVLASASASANYKVTMTWKRSPG
jgi:hypothetical protein